MESIREGMGRNDVMDFASWKLFRVRPPNFPARRLAGMCGLMTPVQGKRLLQGMMERSRMPRQKKGRFFWQRG